MTRKPSILTQLIIGFSVILLLILSITSFFSYHYSSRVVVEKTSRFMLESVKQIRGKTDVMLLEYDRLSQRVAFSPQVQQHFSAIKRGKAVTLGKADINRFASEQARLTGSELTIHLIDSKGQFYSHNDALTLNWSTEEELHRIDWFSEIQARDGRMLWVSGPAWSNGTVHAVIGARQLNEWSTLEPLGDLFVMFSIDTLRRVIEEDDQSLTRNIQFIDSRGIIVYSMDVNKIGTPADASLVERMKNKEEGLFNWSEEGQPSYVAYSTSSYSGWTVVAYIDAASAVKDLKQMQKGNLWIGIFAICAALLLVTFFAWTVTRPIRYLAHRLSRVERGILTPSKSTLINHEVATLFESFNRMVTHLNETIQDLSSRQATEKQAQIIALKAQFRPHFLYNSLNTIYWQLINDDNEKAAEMVHTLSDLMRYSIQPGSEFVTVREDLDQLDRYLLLQRARFGEKLQVTIEADEALYPCKMMKMLLQPLVENAISHGLETVKGRKWHIHIEIRHTEEGLLLAVEDNGIGMSVDEMARALDPKDDMAATSMSHSGLGLANLHQRIRLVYGKDYGIQLMKGSNGGLRVEIVLPMDSEGGM
ncbi:sensor histidine kinase YesM [Paenibacillus sp. CCS19]|uniref:cache domain-containing sensor histidine kinase n=1 Tax=Paenibacillus sp. CCS19 TaxID=3158387 RepID=UPI002564B47B|nr:sensor histidine kinase [Paenibacillus cellulosilyticus]GMK41874.1 sensor histidine kinase YesM [Paenibacillus cellulosilyticus]